MQFKRAFDLIIAVMALSFSSPLLVMGMLAVRIKMGSPIFFFQTRPGLNQQPFTMIKLRTMKIIADPNGNPLSDKERLTSVGKLLRKSSIDELPALWNVIRGEMSLVGPRPLLMEYLPLYNHQQLKRHNVKPGITGLAQVNGRNSLTWEKKFELDVWYVENQSIILDLKILILTVWHVLRMAGISSPGHSTQPKFLGSTKNHNTTS